MCPSDLAGIVVQDPVLPNDSPPPPPPKASSAIFEDEEKSKVCKDKEEVFFHVFSNWKDAASALCLTLEKHLGPITSL